MRKIEFAARPEAISEKFCRDAGGFSWQDFVTAIPSPVFLVTGYKPNGRENACLQSWASFVGGGTDEFICLMPMSGGGHMAESLRRTGVCALNFPSVEIYPKCVKTIGNNRYEADEITASGLTAEPCVRIDAPRVGECFLNIECALIWERELYGGSALSVAALRAVHVSMDEERFDHEKLGRYGDAGYLYQIHNPMNPLTGELYAVGAGTIRAGEPFEWNP